MEILNLKERYPFACYCENVIEASPSIFMSGFQMNLGGVHCPKCKTHISVQIDENNENFIPVGIASNGDIKDGPLPAACYRKATPEEEAIINRKSEEKIDLLNSKKDNG